MGRFHLLRQLLPPSARYHRGGKPPNTDDIVQRQLSQPIVTNTLQGEAKLLIVLPEETVSIVLQQRGFQPAKHLSDHGKFLHQRVTLPRITSIERGHHHPSHAVAWHVRL